MAPYSIYLLHLTDRVKHNRCRVRYFTQYWQKMTTQRIFISKTTSAGTDSSRTDNDDDDTIIILEIKKNDKDESNTRSMQDNELKWDQYDEYLDSNSILCCLLVLHNKQ